MGFANFKDFKKGVVRRSWDIDVPELFPEGTKNVTLRIVEPMQVDWMPLMASYQEAASGMDNSPTSNLVLLCGLVSELLRLVVVDGQGAPFFPDENASLEAADALMKGFMKESSVENLNEFVLQAFEACDVDLAEIVRESQRRVEAGQGIEGEEDDDTNPFGRPLRK